jgi:hypothetical protein
VERILHTLPSGARFISANPEELRTFFKGFRRVLASMGQAAVAGEAAPPPPARERNPQAFAAWTPEAEADVRRRFQGGQSVAEIARAHKRSPRAIELRLQRLGLVAADSRGV